MINTLFLTMLLTSLLLLLSFDTFKHTSMAFCAILTSYLKNSEIKTTLDTFRDCCVDFLLTFLEISVYLEPPSTSTPSEGPTTCKQNNTSRYKPPPPPRI